MAFMRRFGAERRRLAERNSRLRTEVQSRSYLSGVEPYARAMTLAKTGMLALKSMQQGRMQATEPDL
jgi:hypothetical protein